MTRAGTAPKISADVLITDHPIINTIFAGKSATDGIFIGFTFEANASGQPLEITVKSNDYDLQTVNIPTTLTAVPAGDILSSFASTHEILAPFTPYIWSKSIKGDAPWGSIGSYTGHFQVDR